MKKLSQISKIQCSKTARLLFQITKVNILYSICKSKNNKTVKIELQNAQQNL